MGRNKLRQIEWMGRACSRNIPKQNETIALIRRGTIKGHIDEYLNESDRFTIIYLNLLIFIVLLDFFWPFHPLNQFFYPHFFFLVLNCNDLIGKRFR